MSSSSPFNAFALGALSPPPPPPLAQMDSWLKHKKKKHDTTTMMPGRHDDDDARPPALRRALHCSHVSSHTHTIPLPSKRGGGTTPQAFRRWEHMGRVGFDPRRFFPGMAGHLCPILRATSLSLHGDPAKIGRG